MAIHPLQSYGSISMGDINEELGRARNSNISLNSAQNGGYGQIKSVLPRPTSGNEASIGEWRGYNHSIIDTVRPTAPHLQSIYPSQFSGAMEFIWLSSSDNVALLRYEIWIDIYGYGEFQWFSETDAFTTWHIIWMGGLEHMSHVNVGIIAVDYSENRSAMSNILGFSVNNYGGDIS
jgi:hypothetical protein